MGSKAEQPKKLADKLRRIREKLGLSQAGMADAIERHGVRTQRGSIVPSKSIRAYLRF
jgi:transcriptional regulator with XRE-family HTH domain